MKKEELMKIEGMTEGLADKLVETYGNTVPHTRLNEVIRERDEAKQQLTETLEKLGTLEKTAADAETLRGQISALKADAETAKAQHEAQIKQIRIDAAVEKALISAGSLNHKAVKALLNDLTEYDEEAGTVKGLSEQIEQLKTADDSKFLFSSSHNKIKGAKAGEAGNEDGDQKVDTSHMTYTEMLAYAETHPDAKF